MAAVHALSQVPEQGDSDPPLPLAVSIWIRALQGRALHIIEPGEALCQIIQPARLSSWSCKTVTSSSKS